MRYYIKEFINHDYEIEAMEGIDAYISIQNHEVIHLQPKHRESVQCQSLVNQYYYGIGCQECHDYNQIAQQLNENPLHLVQSHSFLHTRMIPTNHSTFQKIDHYRDFQDIIKDEIKDMIIKQKLQQDSLLYILMKSRGYIYQSIDEYIPDDILDTPIEELKFSIRIYNSLKRAGIQTLGSLRLVLQEDRLSKIRNLGKKQVQETIEVYYQFLNCDFPYHMELKLKQNDTPIVLTYDMTGLSLKSIATKIFKDIFPDEKKSLFSSYDALFTLKITNILLWMGYIYIDEIVPHLAYLDQYFYQLALTSSPDALQSRYQKYYHAHIVFHEIPFSLYQKLKESHASSDQIQYAYQQYCQYIDSIIAQIKSKLCYIEDDEDDSDLWYIHYDDLKTILDSLEDVCVVKDVMKQLQYQCYGYRIVKDINEYKAQIDFMIKHYSPQISKEMIQKLLYDEFLLESQCEELVQYVHLKYNS